MSKCFGEDKNRIKYIFVIKKFRILDQVEKVVIYFIIDSLNIYTKQIYQYYYH